MERLIARGRAGITVFQRDLAKTTNPVYLIVNLADVAVLPITVMMNVCI